jgi:DNA-binding NtrC family response regulator
VIEIHVPALNNRRDDIPLLADHFLSLLTPNKELLPEAVVALQKMDWTGNIRQLRNFIERLHILGGHQISAQDVSTYTLS